MTDNKAVKYSTLTESQADALVEWANAHTGAAFMEYVAALEERVTKLETRLESIEYKKGK